MPTRSTRNPSGSSEAATLLRDVARLHVRAQRALVLRESINQTHCTVLTALADGEGIALGELAARLRMDKGWVSRVVERMVEERLLVREPNPDDARAVRLSPTAAGRRLHARLERLLDEQVDRIVSRVPAHDLPELQRLLDTLRTAYHDELL